jgi:Permuted papain-like amidase enzyme, YaeF/YiiX, C92 family
MTEPLAPGDIIAVHTKGWFGTIIGHVTRSLWSHVAIVHHQDNAGTWWVIEGRPSGVGYATLAHYLQPTYRAVHNADQPKTREQRDLIVREATALLGTPYDWGAIARIGFERLDAQGIGWADTWNGQRPPVAVICSSFAAYLYSEASLPGPHQVLTKPIDWAEFIARRGWQT